MGWCKWQGRHPDQAELQSRRFSIDAVHSINAAFRHSDAGYAWDDRHGASCGGGDC